MDFQFSGQNGNVMGRCIKWLRTHLKAINLYAGETAHSSMRGLAVTLRMLCLEDRCVKL